MRMISQTNKTDDYKKSHANHYKQLGGHQVGSLSWSVRQKKGKKD